MKKGTHIHYVDEQGRLGNWEPMGLAFLDEAKCRAFIIDLNIKWVMENVAPIVFRERLIPHVAEGDLEKMTDAAIEAEVRKVGRFNIDAVMEDEHLGGMIGGLYSFDTLTLEDGEE